MRVGVQEPVAEDHLREELGHGPGDGLRSHPRPLQGAPVRHLPALHPLHGHHAAGAQLRVHAGHAHPRQPCELREARRVALLPAEVGLAFQARLELRQEPPEDLVEPGEEPAGEGARQAERHEVRVDLRLDARVLHLDGDLAPPGEARPVDLREGGHRRRRPLEGFEGLPQGPPQVALQRPAHLAEAPRPGRVLQRPQDETVLLGHLRLLGGDLAELDVDAPVGAGQAQQLAGAAVVQHREAPRGRLGRLGGGAGGGPPRPPRGAVRRVGPGDLPPAVRQARAPHQGPRQRPGVLGPQAPRGGGGGRRRPRQAQAARRRPHPPGPRGRRAAPHL